MAKKREIDKVTDKLERRKDKIEIYATKIVNEHGGKTLCGKLSTYYNLNGRVLRISNHIGVQSSGNISIIIPTYDSRSKTESNYIVHSHQTGEISIMNYEDVKELVRCYGKMSSIIHNAYQPNFEFQFEVKEKFDAKLEEMGVVAELERLKSIEKSYNRLLEKRSKKLENSDIEDSLDPEEIFGVPVRYFTEGQMNMFKCTAKVALKNAVKKNKLPEDEVRLKKLESVIK